MELDQGLVKDATEAFDDYKKVVEASDATTKDHYFGRFVTALSALIEDGFGKCMEAHLREESVRRYERESY